MLKTMCIAIAIAFALPLFVSQTALVDEKFHEGLVVSAAEGKLVMSDKDGKNEHTLMVPTGTKVTLDGKDARLPDLKKGDSVKVTADPEGKVIAIAATRTAP
jgi:hypothetical protein